MARPALVLALALLTSGCITLEYPGGPPPPLEEEVVFGEEGPKILMLEIDGVIRETPDTRSLFTFSQENMLSRLREELDRAREDDEIRAVLLRVNSPGGTVTASDLIYQEILRFKHERDVPVVAQFMGIATSGGYYVAMAADEIVAHPTTVTGSIGVIFSGINLSGLMEKIGVEDQTLVSGPFKDAGTMLRPMRPDERAQLQGVIDDLFERFKSVVDEGRANLDAEQVARLADGRIYSARQAVENGLVDAIGGIEDAVARAEKSAGLTSSRVVSYHRPREYRENLYTRPPSLPTKLELDLLPDWPGIDGPAFLYLWAPGWR